MSSQSASIEHQVNQDLDHAYLSAMQETCQPKPPSHHQDKKKKSMYHADPTPAPVMVIVTGCNFLPPGEQNNDSNGGDRLGGIIRYTL